MAQKEYLTEKECGELQKEFQENWSSYQNKAELTDQEWLKQLVLRNCPKMDEAQRKMLCFPHADGSPEKRQTVIPRMSFRFRFHVDKPPVVFFPSCKSRENFLPFAQSLEILPPGRPDRLWLVDRQPFQEPAVFLTGKVPDF